MVQIEFDRTRTLKFDLAAIRDLESAVGKPLGLIISDVSNLGITALSAALWSGLKHEDRGLSQNLTMKLLEQYIQNRKSMRTLARAVNDALDETGLFRNEDEDVPGNGQPEQATH